jgi:hypothetical protein
MTPVLLHSAGTPGDPPVSGGPAAPEVPLRDLAVPPAPAAVPETSITQQAPTADRPAKSVDHSPITPFSAASPSATRGYIHDEAPPTPSTASTPSTAAEESPPGTQPPTLPPASRTPGPLRSVLDTLRQGPTPKGPWLRQCVQALLTVAPCPSTALAAS